MMDNIGKEQCNMCRKYYPEINMKAGYCPLCQRLIFDIRDDLRQAYSNNKSDDVIKG